jgi:hypothetical protein
MAARSVSVTRQSVTPKALAIALGAFALVLAAGSLAVANIPPNTMLDDVPGIDDVHHDYDETPVPEPVMGDELFIAAAGADGCVDRNAVAAQFLADQAEIGGRTFDFVSGRGQKLADLWRDRTGVGRIAVSSIMTHVFFDRGADEWTADQVEFDAGGCAISRTLLPGAAWAELLTLLGQS